MCKVVCNLDNGVPLRVVSELEKEVGPDAGSFGAGFLEDSTVPRSPFTPGYV
jgi:hypothetical protein